MERGKSLSALDSRRSLMPSYTTLIDAQALARHRDDADWIVVDCRHDLAQPQQGRIDYGAGHIPGARHLHLDDDLSGAKTGRNGRHPLPAVQALEDTFGRIGIDDSKQVVAYDAHGGMYAARLWWLLRWLGHEAVAVLDGGLPAWTDAHQPLTTALPTVRPTRFVAHPRPMHIDVETLHANLQRPEICIVDARAPDRFRGENETLDPVGGHIPGARNRFFRNNLDAHGRFKSAEALDREWRTALGSITSAQVVHQCGSGVTACHNALAMEIAGLYGSRLYPGSWSEWCADANRPVATGDAT